MLKGWLRQTRNLLAVLTQLDNDLEAVVETRLIRELDERMALGGVAHGTTTNGSPRATVRV